MTFREARPSQDDVLMGNALGWSERSTCSRAQVGCVISVDGRTISTGYNGAPAGMPHCDHSSCVCDVGRWATHEADCPVTSPCVVAVHAEINAISFAAKFGVATLNSTLHTTRVPCLTCAGSIINAGIIRVVWLEPHRDMAGIERLTLAGVEVVRSSGGGTK